MNTSKYYLLAYDVALENLSTLYVYKVPEEQVGLARYLLNQERVPHTISKEPGTTGLKICTTDRSSLLESKLGYEYHAEEAKPSEKTLNRLISSAVRLRFLEEGWVSSVSKIYKPDPSKAKPLINNLALRYEHSVRLTVDDLSSGRKALFIDPTSKIEFTKTLDYISKVYPEQAKEISFIKIKGTPTSFYIVHNEEARESYKEVYSKVAEAISVYQGLKVSFPKNTREVVTATPKSLRLNNILRSKIPNLPLSEKRVVLPLPAEVLVPVGTLENVSLFGSTPSLVIPPEERVEKVKNIASELDLERLDFSGIRVKIGREKLLSITSRDFIEISYSNEELKKLWDWEPTFKNDPSRRRLLLIVKLKADIKTYSDKCLQATQKIYEELKNRYPEVFNVQYTDVLVSLEDLDAIVSTYSGGYDEKYVVLLYDRDLDKHGNLVGRFELGFAQRGFYPHVIDLSTEDGYDSKIKFKLMNIIRDFAVRVNAVPSAPSPPPQLRGISVVGIDSTIVPLKRSHVYVGVAITLIKPDGSIDYDVKISRLAESDVDVLTSVIRDELRQNPRLLVIVNKSSLDSFLENLGSETLKDCILVSVTKTHSYSRLLAKYNDKFVNLSKTNLFVRLAPSYNGGVQISRYLANTTTYSRGSYEAGTIRPVLFNIAGSIDHDIILQYLQKLTYYAPISKSWLPSIPWPLHKSDKICKKINRILKAAGESSILVDIPQDVWRKL